VGNSLKNTKNPGFPVSFNLWPPKIVIDFYIEVRDRSWIPVVFFGLTSVEGSDPESSHKEVMERLTNKKRYLMGIIEDFFMT